MINKKVIISTIILWCSAAFPNQIVWLTLTPSYVYKDIYSVCQNMNGLSVEVGAEIRNGHVVAAALSDDPGSQFSPRLVLNSEEREGLAFQSGQNPYLKRIVLSPRMLKFLFERTHLFGDKCKHLPIQSIETDSTIQFLDIDPTFGEGTFHSERVSWWGYRKDGWGWNLEVRLTQEPYKTERQD